MAVVATVAWAQPKPAGGEQARMLEAARAAALDYAKALPDFLCTETAERISMTGRFVRAKDTLRIQVTYFGRKENYKLLTINGAATEQAFDSLQGLISGGEFGSLLVRVFEPATEAKFEWKAWGTVGKRRAAVYTYEVARERSHFTVGYRAADGEMRTATVAQKGQVALDAESSRVLRLTTEAVEIGREIPALRATSAVEYGFVTVAGGMYLLPVKAESEMERSQQEVLRSVVTFTGYRKFTADSTVEFSGAEGKKK